MGSHNVAKIKVQTLMIIFPFSAQTAHTPAGRSIGRTQLILKYWV